MKLALLISATLVVALSAAGTVQADPLDKLDPGPIKLCPQQSETDPGCIACGVIQNLTVTGLAQAIVECL